MTGPSFVGQLSPLLLLLLLLLLVLPELLDDDEEEELPPSPPIAVLLSPPQPMATAVTSARAEKIRVFVSIVCPVLLA